MGNDNIIKENFKEFYKKLKPLIGGGGNSITNIVYGIYNKSNNKFYTPSSKGYTIEIPRATEASDKIRCSRYYSNRYAWHVFDKLLGDSCWCSGSDGPDWVSYEFDKPYIATKWQIGNYIYSGSPKISRAILQGSNDNSTWTNLDERSRFPGTTELQTYEINNDTAYKYYRLYLYNNGYWIDLSEFNVICEVPPGELVEADAKENCIYISTDTNKAYYYDGEKYVIINGTDYSTEEHIIGTWVNGKPLYQKVLNGLKTIENGSIYSLDSNINVIDIRGKCYDSNGEIHMINSFISGQYYLSIDISRDNDIICNCNGWINNDLDLIIQYTKND